MYYKRIADDLLCFKLETFGAACIVGPKWCGKTTTAIQHAKSILDLQDTDMRDQYLKTAETKPSLLLKGENPRLIDEWQDAPILWDAVRKEIDYRKADGLFILTGSTSRNIKTMHTGTGRISKLRMYPMSLFESEESNGLISLKELFDNPRMDIDGIQTNLSFEKMVFAACRGGWPSYLSKRTSKSKLEVAKDYLRQIYETDICAIDDVKRNPKWARAILRSYARNLSTLAKKATILKDTQSDAETFSIETLDSYIDALERLFVIEDLDAWCPSIRNATTMRSGKKREFTDPSLPVAALGMSPEYFQTDLKTFGFIFECMCIRDLRVYSQALGGELSYYRDRYGLEADSVLRLNDGRYALIEYKLGSKDIEEGAKHLLKIKELVKQYNITERQCPLREPDLLMIITGDNMAYTRTDQIKIIPIGCLKD